MKWYRLRYSLIIILVIVLCAASYPSADEPEVIRVGYMEDSSFIRQYTNGQYYGYGVEYLEQIAEYTGWEYEFVQSSFAGLCDMLERGEIDLVCVMQKTEEREEKYLYSDYQAGWEYASLYVSEEYPVDYEDFEAFDGMRIGFLNGFQSNEDFKIYAEQNGFSYEAFYYEISEEMDAAFAAGELDAITRSSLLTDTGCRLVSRYSAEPFYFATGKKNALLLTELNQVLKKIRLKNPNYEEELQDRYYPNIMSGTLSLAEKEYIANAPVLRVSYNDKLGLGPVSYKQDGQMMGVSAEVFECISDRTGLKFEFVEYKTPYEAWMAAVNGEADMMACIESRNLRAEGVVATEPYFEVPMVLVAKNETDMTGTIRIALRGSDGEMENYIADAFTDYELIYYATIEECFDAVLAGDAEFALENSLLVSALMSGREYSRLLVNTIADYSTKICIGVNQEENPLLLSILNKTITGITNTERTQMVARALSEKRVELSVSEIINENLDKLTIVVLAVIVAVMAIRRVQKRKREHELEMLAYYDDLTGLRKQEKFLIDLEKILKENADKKFALVYLDIERFRYLNSVLGYAKSNELIKEFSRMLNGLLEQRELSGRLYADDFIVLYEYTDQEQIIQRLQKLRSGLRDGALQMEIYYKVNVQAGVYLIEDKTEKYEEMIYRASLAKQMCTGGAETYFFDEYLEKKLHKELEIESIMEEALVQEEFHAFYQPKYSVNGERLVGAEALVRWIRPDGSMIYPNDFIPLFEKNGFILQLDYYMYRQVLRFLRKRLDRQEPVVRISVNLSRLHNGDSHMGETLVRMAEEYQIPPELIEFELTESAFTDHADNILEQLGMLREKGFSVSIDDFGAGYSSLNLLRSVSADILKIDKAFLDETEDSERSSYIIRDIVGMAKDICMEVICEGVETVEQLHFLREINCDYAQGYYFAKPLPEEGFVKKLNEGK